MQSNWILTQQHYPKSERCIWRFGKNFGSSAGDGSGLRQFLKQNNNFTKTMFAGQVDEVCQPAGWAQRVQGKSETKI